MTQEQLLEHVAKAANTQVQNRIRQFRTEVQRAYTALLGETYPTCEMFEECLQALSGKRKGWPSKLWRDMEKQVMDEVLGTMDTLQRMLIEPPSTGTEVPADDVKQEGDSE